jgi:hypothetical protein
MKQSQNFYYDEDGNEYVYDTQPGGGHGGRLAIGVVIYFLLLAILMIPARMMNLGMQGIFLAMAGAGAALGLGWLIVKLVIHKFQSMQLSGQGFLQVMMGYRPQLSPVVNSASRSGREVALVGSVAVMPYYGEGEEEHESQDDGDLPDSIIEEDGLYLADCFQPAIRWFLGMMTLIIGMRRSGKSNLLAVLLEEFGLYEDLPLLVCDTEDEYGGLVEKKYLAHAVHVGSAAGRRESPHPENYIVVDQAGAYAFGRAILDGRLQVILNLKSWEDEEAALIMCRIIDGLNSWEEERKNEDRLPVMVFLDEAQKWLPQNTGDKWVSKETQVELHHAFFDIVVARGGKRGFGLVVATQRYSQINKNLLQSAWKFLFWQTEEIDVGKYERMGLDASEVVSLRQGECFIFSPIAIGFKAMMRERTSPHMAHTPGLENLRKQSSKALPLRSVLSRSYASSAPEVAPAAKETRHLELVAPQQFDEELEQEDVSRAPSIQRPPNLDARQQLALAYYQQGYTNNVKLAMAMTQDGSCGTISDSAAYRLILELEARGFIDRRKKSTNG